MLVIGDFSVLKSEPSDSELHSPLSPNVGIINSVVIVNSSVVLSSVTRSVVVVEVVVEVDVEVVVVSVVVIKSDLSV